MTNEEKLKLAESLYNKVRFMSSPEARETALTLEQIFPELRESEDGRIRRWLYNDVRASIENGFYSDERIDDAKDALSWLEKQDEQELSWSEEDEKKIDLLIAILEVNHSNGQFKVNPINTTNMETMSSKELVNWIKSIKSIKSQPKQEWSEEDRKHIDNIISLLNQAKERFVRESGQFPSWITEILWLKSLKPCWKPTKEQMEALHWVAEYGNITQSELLKSLYNDLKNFEK